jgi:hypothetical protein
LRRPNNELSISWVSRAAILKFLSQTFFLNLFLRFVSQICFSNLFFKFVFQICESELFFKFVSQVCFSNLLNLFRKFVSRFLKFFSRIFFSNFVGSNPSSNKTSIQFWITDQKCVFQYRTRTFM